LNERGQERAQSRARGWALRAAGRAWTRTAAVRTCWPRVRRVGWRWVAGALV